MSKNPDTNDYIMVLDYAEGGNFNSWLNKNFINFDWVCKMETLFNIIEGLVKIHENNLVHHDFHTGNILFDDPILRTMDHGDTGDILIFISDMGLCGEVENVNKDNIYGIMPYVAPEVLCGKPYTQAADIYSFGMIMYFVATGSQPFANHAHDNGLVNKIFNGIRPELNESEIPKFYIDLMRQCWDSNPENRPKSDEILELISLIARPINKNNFEEKKREVTEQFKEADEYRKAQISSIIENRQLNTHPQAVYTSRLLNPYTKDLFEQDKFKISDEIDFISLVDNFEQKI
ncbi:kinase-like domain-containing protein [Glomus cerebriforme]|uniref:Kinase-like domain-containing protein n=1 Tax=Glomus cerebriforme TaxID=658196 RepID=A0A397SH55_9GLOM|nr:kinase-like domain-containing protein [Glomus cerebriforme]